MCLKAVASGRFCSRREIPTVIPSQVQVIDFLVRVFPDIEFALKSVDTNSAFDEVGRAIRGCLAYCVYIVDVSHEKSHDYFSVNHADIEKVLFRWRALNDENQDRFNPVWFAPD